MWQRLFGGGRFSPGPGLSSEEIRELAARWQGLAGAGWRHLMPADSFLTAEDLRQVDYIFNELLTADVSSMPHGEIDMDRRRELTLLLHNTDGTSEARDPAAKELKLDGYLPRAVVALADAMAQEPTERRLRLHEFAPVVHINWTRAGVETWLAATAVPRAIQEQYETDPWRSGFQASLASLRRVRLNVSDLEHSLQTPNPAARRYAGIALGALGANPNLSKNNPFSGRSCHRLPALCTQI